MKKLSFIIIPLLFAPLLSSCGCVYNNGINDRKDYAITAVKLNVDKLEIRVGNEKTQLIATIEATGEFTDAISLSFKDEGLASLDKSEVKSGEEFYITALKAGETTLTATAKSDTSKTATIPVKVLEIDPIIPVESVSLDKSSESLYIGKTCQLIATVLPLNATNQLVKYESSDKNVATVSDTGLVSAISTGTATIKVATVDGGKTAECIFNISKELEINGYYLNGKPNDWKANGLYQLEKNTGASSDKEYMIKFSGKAGDEFKVAKYLAENTYEYYPMAYSGSGVNETISDSIELNYDTDGNIHVIVDGDYTLYFDLNATDGTNYKYWINPGHKA